MPVLIAMPTPFDNTYDLSETQLAELEEAEEMMLKNVIIEHKGNRVQVGSGFSHEQRRHYFKNPNEILGKQITVQYFEETTNKNGTHSLRFPVIKAVYDGVRTF